MRQQTAVLDALYAHAATYLRASGDWKVSTLLDSSEIDALSNTFDWGFVPIQHAISYTKKFGVVAALDMLSDEDDWEAYHLLASFKNEKGEAQCDDGFVCPFDDDGYAHDRGFWL